MMVAVSLQLFTSNSVSFGTRKPLSDFSSCFPFFLPFFPRPAASRSLSSVGYRYLRRLRNRTNQLSVTRRSCPASQAHVVVFHKSVPSELSVCPLKLTRWSTETTWPVSRTVPASAVHRRLPL